MARTYPPNSLNYLSFLEGLETSLDRFGQPIETVAPFQHEDGPARAGLPRDLAEGFGHSSESIPRHVHASQGVQAVGVVSGGNQEEIGSISLQGRHDFPIEGHQVFMIPLATREWDVQRRAFSLPFPLLP